MRDRPKSLFSDKDLRAVLDARQKQMFAEIDGIETNRLLNTSVEDLEQYFEDQYRLDAPVLREEDIYVDQAEIQIDVRHDQNRIIHDKSRPFYVTGTRITYSVPFDGNADLFACAPSARSSMPPQAEITGNELHVRYDNTNHDPERLRNEFDRNLDQIRQYLRWINNDISTFNRDLRQKAKGRIEARRAKLLKDQGLVASLGFPLKKRPDAPQTFVTPTVRRKPKISMPQATTAPYSPEPTLDMGEYEHILAVAQNMVAVMERSPHAFHDMHEEDLRQHFLVQLNGQYEGQASGETFNYAGKTDILVRVDNRNIFIGECKFWNGPKAFTETIDQILGYSSWRDTKVSIFLFNRQKDLTHVLNQIPELLQQHPNFKRQVNMKSETTFRAIMHHPGDTNRELTLTTAVFDIPKLTTNK